MMPQGLLCVCVWFFFNLSKQPQHSLVDVKVPSFTNTCCNCKLLQWMKMRIMKAVGLNHNIKNCRLQGNKTRFDTIQYGAI